MNIGLFLNALKNFLLNMELADKSKNPRPITNKRFDGEMIKRELKEAVKNCMR
jgi:hypothetical protein